MELLLLPAVAIVPLVWTVLTRRWHRTVYLVMLLMVFEGALTQVVLPRLPSPDLFSEGWAAPGCSRRLHSRSSAAWRARAFGAQPKSPPLHQLLFLLTADRQSQQPVYVGRAHRVQKLYAVCHSAFHCALRL